MKLQHSSKTQWTIPGVGDTDEHGVIDVPDDVAGRPPDPRFFEAMTELADAVDGHPDHDRAVALRAEIGRLDLGTGLLAQDTWKPHGTKAKAEAAQKTEGDK